MLETRVGDKFVFQIHKMEDTKFLGKEMYLKIYKLTTPNEADNSYYEKHQSFEGLCGRVVSESILWNQIMWYSDRVEIDGQTIQHPLSFKFYKLHHI